MLKFKVLFVGDSCIGAKTSLIQRIVYNNFLYDMKTSSIEEKKVSTPYGEINLKLYDTAGQERFRPLTISQYKNSDCIIIGYSITRRKSFEDVLFFYESIIKEKGDSVIIYLVANQIDNKENEEVTEEEGRQIAEKLKIKFFQVSAKTGEGVDDLVNDIANTLALTKQKGENKNNNLKIEKQNNKKNKHECVK